MFGELIDGEVGHFVDIILGGEEPDEIVLGEDIFGLF
jgi:hypothetical protein